MAEIVLRAEDHVYFVDGKETPGVTTVMDKINLVDTTWFKEEHSVRGIAVHRGTELMDLESLVWSTVDESIEGYLWAWEKCKHENNIKVIDTEKKLWHPDFDYCGTLDRFVEFGSEPLSVLDIKSGAETVGTRYQLAAYKELAHANGFKVSVTARSVHLKKDGSYKIEQWTERKDWPQFASMLNTYNILKKNGRLVDESIHY